MFTWAHYQSLCQTSWIQSATYILFKTYFNVLPSMPGASKWPPSDDPTNMLWAFLIAPKHVTCTIHLSLLDMIIQIPHFYSKLQRAHSEQEYYTNCLNISNRLNPLNCDLIPLYIKEVISVRWQAFPFSCKKELNPFGLEFQRGYLKMGITVHKICCFFFCKLLTCLLTEFSSNANWHGCKVIEQWQRIILLKLCQIQYSPDSFKFYISYYTLHSLMMKWSFTLSFTCRKEMH